MKFFKKSLAILFGALIVFGIISVFPSLNQETQAAVPFTVVINPGHGPASTGTGAVVDGVKESILNEQLSAKICAALRARGVNVILTNKMTTVSDPAPYALQDPPVTGGQYSFLTPKPELMTAVNRPWEYNPSLTQTPDLALSIHHNSFSNSSANGFQVFYSSTIAGTYGKNSTSVALSKEAAYLIDGQFKKSGFYLNPRSVSDSENNSLTKYSGVPCVLIEAGFMTNPSDFAKMQNGNNQQMLADRLADAVVQYKQKHQSYAPPELRSLSVTHSSKYEPIFKVNAGISDASSVTAAIWTEKSNQADLKWYNMRHVGNGAWELFIDANQDFKFATDKYVIHLYASDASGASAYMGATSTLVERDSTPPVARRITSSSDIAEITYNSSGVSVFAENVTDNWSGVAGVRVAIWSLQNNQKDLRWYNLGNLGSNNWGALINLQDFSAEGEYIIHAYATDKLGNDGFIGVKKFTVKRDRSAPTSTAVKGILAGERSSTFTAIADNVKDPSGIKGVRFAVWTEHNGQDDLKWYAAQNDGRGNWMVAIDAKNHKDESGKYIIHAYGTDMLGNDGLLGYSSIVVKHKDYIAPTAKRITTGAQIWTEPSLSIFAENVQDDWSGVSNVRVAVWSIQNNQRDLKWYNLGSIGSNNWATSINKKDFSADGEYMIHAYATDKAGNDGFIGAKTISVIHDKSAPTSPAIKGILAGERSSTFTAIADSVSDPSGVSGVRFAVWTEWNGQDDLKWYRGQNDGRGNWMVAIDAKNHNNEYGKYIIHAYGTDNLGNDGFMGASSVTVMHRDIKPPTASGLSVSANPVTNPEISVFAENVVDDWSGVDNVRIAVWSNANGQDDIKWYNLGNIGGNNWGRTINMTDFNTIGNYTIHAYARDKAGNDGLIGSKTIDVTVSAIGGYKIMGPADVSANQLANYYMNSGGWAWDSAQYQGLTLQQFCQKYIDYANAEGVKADVAFAQMCLETRNLNYGNLVTRDQWNFAGLGSTGSILPETGLPDKGIYFSSVDNGILAQIQHLKAYASTNPLNMTSPPEYNRFGYIQRGCAPTVQMLSGKWATDPNYGTKIMDKINAIASTPK